MTQPGQHFYLANMHGLERGSNFLRAQDRMNFKCYSAHLEDKIVNHSKMCINDTKFPCLFLARRINQSLIKTRIEKNCFHMVFD